MAKNKAIIVDLDGTLALRNPEGQTLYTKGNEKYRGIHEYHRVGEDLLHPPIRLILTSLHDFLFPDLEILITTGRPDSCVAETSNWLIHHQVPYSKIFMRKTGDFRKDFIVKKEIYDSQIKDNYDVLFVLDDRQQVVDMWRAEGLVCLQVAPGDF